METDYKCKGLFWRASQSTYVSSYNSIEVRKSLRLLKKQSCNGCGSCGWVLETIKELISLDDKIDWLDDIIPGAVYTFKIETSQGYYDLYPEVDNISFVKADLRGVGERGSDEHTNLFR